MARDPSISDGRKLVTSAVATTAGLIDDPKVYRNDQCVLRTDVSSPQLQSFSKARRISGSEQTEIASTSTFDPPEDDQIGGSSSLFYIRG